MLNMIYLLLRSVGGVLAILCGIFLSLGPKQAEAQQPLNLPPSVFIRSDTNGHAVLCQNKAGRNIAVAVVNKHVVPFTRVLSSMLKKLAQARGESLKELRERIRQLRKIIRQQNLICEKDLSSTSVPVPVLPTPQSSDPVHTLVPTAVATPIFTVVATAVPESGLVTPIPLLGTRRLAVVVVNFDNSAHSLSVDQFRQAFFGSTRSVAALFRDMSLSRFTLTGDVFGPFTVSSEVPPITDCRCVNIPILEQRADEALAASGINAEQYDHVMYLFAPFDPSYCHVGNAEQGGRRSYIFELGGAYGSLIDRLDAIVHELGHNFGLGHANSVSSAYGDLSDMMGLSQGVIRGFNAPHLVQLGWLPDTNIQVINAPGRYIVHTLDQPISAPQVLVVPQSGAHGNIYLSLRTPTGYAANLPGWTEQYGTRYVNRVNVHTWDPTASGPWCGWVSPMDTKFMGALDTEMEYVAWTAGIKVRPVEIRADYAEIEVSFFKPAAADDQAPQIESITVRNPGYSPTIEVNVSDNVGVTSVSLFAPHGLFDTLTRPPYIFAYENLPMAIPEVNSLIIIATDAAGNVSQQMNDPAFVAR